MTDRNPIVGDLLEEYREHVLPTRGRPRAILWFALQLASLVKPWMWGIALGLIVGIENLVDSYLWPEPHDGAIGVVTLWLSIVAVWGLVGAGAASRSQRLSHGLVSGAVVAAVSMVLMYAANFVRLNVVIDVAARQMTWGQLVQGLLASAGNDLTGLLRQELIDCLQGVAGAAAVGSIVGGIGGGVKLRRARPA